MGDRSIRRSSSPGRSIRWIDAVCTLLVLTNLLMGGMGSWQRRLLKDTDSSNPLAAPNSMLFVALLASTVAGSIRTVRARAVMRKKAFVVALFSTVCAVAVGWGKFYSWHPRLEMTIYCLIAGGQLLSVAMMNDGASSRTVPHTLT